MPDVWGSADPGSILKSELLHQRVEIEWDANNNPIFVGWAIPSGQTPELKWRICKIIYDVNNNPLRVLWANRTNAYLFSWNDRANPAIITYDTT
jgi:hypothetical protein